MLSSSGGPIPFDQPTSGLIGVSASEHPPELMKDIGVDKAKGTRCHHVPVIVGPASKYLVELFNNYHNRRALVFAGQCSNLTHEELDALCCRGDVQRLLMFA